MARMKKFSDSNGQWSPTGKPVVPNNHTRLRQWALKRLRAQPPRLRRVIRPAAKSAEARLGYIGKVPSRVTPSPAAQTVVSCVGDDILSESQFVQCREAPKKSIIIKN